MGAAHYNSTVWVMGGWGEEGALSDVWAWRRQAQQGASDLSGAWVRMTESAGWGARHSLAVMVLPRSDTVGAVGGLNETTLFVIGGMTSQDSAVVPGEEQKQDEQADTAQHQQGASASVNVSLAKTDKASAQGVWSSQDGRVWENVTHTTGGAAHSGFAAVAHITPCVHAPVLDPTIGAL
jgi:hypothetical protein